MNLVVLIQFGVPTMRDVHFYFITNQITDDDIKRAVFLSIVEDKTYQLIRGLLSQ